MELWHLGDLLFFLSGTVENLAVFLEYETVGLSQIRLEKAPPPPSVYLPCILFQILGERWDHYYVN